jgi:hypothetical protein
MSYPVSLGSVTHTRVDSAAKHIRQCKVNERLMLNLNGITHDVMHRNKNKYATMKDDLVLNVNESLGPISTATEAYPSVLSNFTGLHPQIHQVIKEWYKKKTPLDFHELKAKIQENPQTALQETLGAGKAPDDTALKQLKMLPYFRAQGYALGRAEGCQRTGDTVFSVLIGGQMTVNNGHFPMRPGQMVQWYFDFEADQFKEDGSRSDDREQNSRSRLGKRAHEETNAESTCVAMPKPYVLNQDGTEVYGDKIRIFAKCIMGGPAFHKVDIMLMTQSL